MGRVQYFQQSREFWESVIPPLPHFQQLTGRFTDRSSGRLSPSWYRCWCRLRRLVIFSRVLLFPELRSGVYQAHQPISRSVLIPFSAECLKVKHVFVASFCSDDSPDRSNLCLFNFPTHSREAGCQLSLLSGCWVFFWGVGLFFIVNWQCIRNILKANYIFIELYSLYSWLQNFFLIPK